MIDGKRSPDMLDSVTKQLVSFGGTMASLMILGMTFLVAINVFFRSVPSLRSLTFAEEHTGYLFVGLSFLGLADTFVANGHVRVSVVRAKMGNRFRNFFEVPLTIIAMAVTGVVGWFGAKLTWSSMINGELAQTVSQTPLWIPRIAMPIGCVILILALIGHLRAALRGEIGSAGGEGDTSNAD